MKTLLIRADSTPQMGTGHVMRMLALAQAHRRRGGKVVFLTAECPLGLSERIENDGFLHEALGEVELGSAEDAQRTIALSERFSGDCLVLDGYHFREDYQKLCRDAGLQLCCVDDFGHCSDWVCQILLNQNLGSERDPCAKEGLRELRGTRFALLREEFLALSRKKIFEHPIQRVLVTMGGSDPNNATEWVLRELADIPEIAEKEVRVIIGGANPHREELQQISLLYPVTWKVDVKDMSSEYAWADGVVSAGGSSCWEWLAAGLPGVVVTIAENQEPVSAELQRQCLAVTTGYPDEKEVGGLLGQWLQDPRGLIDQDAVGQAIDGRGADRVAAVLDGSDCLLREMALDRDERFTFELANSPSVRAAGYSQEAIGWEDHVAWMTRHISAASSHLFVVESVAGESLGVLRFHQREDGGEWELGISLSEHARGRGLAGFAVRLGMTELALRFAQKSFSATIRPTNEASLRLFQGLGFERRESNNERQIWTCQLS